MAVQNSTGNTQAPRPPLEKAVEDAARVRLAQLEELPRSQLGIEWLTKRIGRPWFAYAIVTFILLWIVSDLALHPDTRFDAPAFPLLQLLLSMAALLMAALILITENRQGVIAEKRTQLILHLSIANEERAAKIVALLEQLRKDDPLIPDRHDPEARQMSEATDLQTAIDTMNAADESDGPHS